MVTKPDGPADVTQCFVSRLAELAEVLPRLRAALAPRGTFWITYPKGTSMLATDLNRDIIRAHAEVVGLLAVAISAVDEDRSAMRLKPA